MSLRKSATLSYTGFQNKSTQTASIHRQDGISNCRGDGILIVAIQDRKQQSFSLLESPTLAHSLITEKYDLQEFIANSSGAFFSEIGEELFLLGKQILPSKNVQDRIDLLAVDKEGTCVVIELKRGNHKLHMMQAISYAGMISHWVSDDLVASRHESGMPQTSKSLCRAAAYSSAAASFDLTSFI